MSCDRFWLEKSSLYCNRAVLLSMILWLFVAVSCNNRPDKITEMKNREQSAIDLDPRLENADSLVVVFYDDPFSADSLRYTRYYKQVTARPDDSLFAQLKSSYVKGEKTPCRGEGKIWCFTGGKIFQTLYFSTQCDECCFLYLIKDGNFYFSRTSPAFLGWLTTQKARLPK